jgi:uncharacterized protein YndB with AHSA1/START domain
MATARRSRTIGAPQRELWALIADPHHLPRWWPRVERVEAVTERGFTEVYMSRRGRRVRMDFEVLVAREPEHCAWEQQLPGTPFERFLAQSRIEVWLEPEPQGTRVTLEMRQAPRGISRFGGGLVFRRAAGRRLAEALEALARIAG